MRKKCFLMMALLLVAFSFAGCTNDDDEMTENNSLIVGTWVSIHSTGYEIRNGSKETWDEEGDGYTIAFRQNGTYYDDEGASGTWSYTDATLTMTKGSQTPTCKIVKLTSSTLILLDTKGTTYQNKITFRRQ